MNKTIAPLDGWPKTVRTTLGSGETAIRISLDTLTPQRAELADALAGLTILALLAGGVWTLACVESVQTWGHATLLLGGPILAHPLITRISHGFFKGLTIVTFTPAGLTVARWHGARHYDRLLPHQFTALPHDRAALEKDQHDYEIRAAQKRGQVVQPTRYYGNARHVVLLYDGIRHDVATVYPVKAAQAVLERLMQADREMNKLIRMGSQRGPNPEDQWNDDTGAIQ